MHSAAGAFDAWGSALVSGVVAAVAVVIGVVLAQRFADARRVNEDRRRAATELIEQVSNVRDYACGKSRGLTGDYSMYPLRNGLFLTFSALQRLPSYEEVRKFYDAVFLWREWVRRRQPRGAKSVWTDAHLDQLRHYQAALSDYAEDVIRVLQQELHARTLRFERPELPPLPDLPELC
jgi:hypothetical protein